MAEQALSDLKVVELGSMVTAPFCTKLLADMGAEVIKVEEPGVGDEARRHGPFLGNIPHLERSGLFLYLNTNKLGVTLNIKTPTGRNILKQILRDADVFVENNPPKMMKELGLDYKSLEKVNPRLIVTSITPFGQWGPYRDYKGYCINTDAAGGASIGIGDPRREPLMMPMSQGEHQAGLGAAGATLTALFARDMTGKGQQVDISVAEIWACQFVGMYVVAYIFQGVSGLRSGHRSPLGRYPQTILECKDGYVMLSAPQVEQWVRFVKAMGEPEWTKNPRYRDRRAMGEQYPDEVDALLAPWLMAHTKDEIFKLCLESKVPFAPVQTTAEVVNNTHYKARGFFVDVDRAETGVLKYPGAPFKMLETPWQISRPAPLLGEHNEEVYCRRLGYTKEDLAELGRAGVI